MSEITKQEFEQYDRQIRLWGIDAQKRLRKSKVLLIGMGGLGAEIAKNLVLSGIDSITLMDDRNVEEVNFTSQFFLKQEDVGRFLFCYLCIYLRVSIYLIFLLCFC